MHKKSLKGKKISKASSVEDSGRSVMKVHEAAKKHGMAHSTLGKKAHKGKK
jgi:hypothetical protein